MSKITATDMAAWAELPKNFRYRVEGKMITLDEAKKQRLAYKDTGLPTKISILRAQKKEAKEAGTDIPLRSKKTYEAGSQSHNDVPSPYDLNRRSGYRTIWQILAENANQFVSVEDLQAEVNKRLKEEDAGDWYERRYSETPYDAETNAYVMTRAPYNVKIEAMAQRVVKEDEGFMLMTEVAEPRTLKKKGRKAKAKVEDTPSETPAGVPVETAPVVETDEDTSVTIVETPAPVEVEA